MKPIIFSLSRALLRPCGFKSRVLIAATLFCQSPANATSAVALIDSKHHRVVIAADCRVAHRDGSGSECKIIDELGCTAAMAGLYWEETTTFHLRKLVTAACRFPGDLRDKAEAFVRVSEASYERAARHIREVDPMDFHRTIENKPTEVIFAGIEKGRLAVLVRGLVADSKGTVTVERYEATDTPHSSIGFFAGLNLRIREYLASHNDWTHEDLLVVARKFVEIEIKAYPELAGPPVSEIEIDERGTLRWINRGACENRETD